MRLLDIHCHVFPSGIARRATKAVADFYGVVQGREVADLSGSLECVLKTQQEAGICLSVLCSAATTPHQVRPINAFLARCVEEGHGRCLAFGTLHPDSDDIAGDIDHMISLGICGVKFHPEMQKCALDSVGMMNLVEAAEDRLPFLLHTGDKRFPYSNPEQLIPLLKAFPHTRFIGAHMGSFQVWGQGAACLPGRFDNLWVDLSSTAMYTGNAALHRMIRSFGAERVLFGTDFPMLEPKTEVRHFLELPLTQREREMIAWDNAAALLGL